MTSRLTLATGVLPVDRRSVTEIGARVHARRLPQDRLVLGIGSGQTAAGALRLVADAARELRAAVSATVVVGALGPRMRRLAIDRSDGVLLSWLTPRVAGRQASAAHASASDRLASPCTSERLSTPRRIRVSRPRRHGTRRFPAYAANFARLSIDPDDTVLDAATGPPAARLEEYRRAVDEVVLRAITVGDETEDYLRFIDRARLLV